MSIGLNIAEGCNSEHDQEFIRFLNIAKNSAFEVIAITLIAESLYNIKPGIVKDNTEEIIKMINGLRNI